MKASDRDILFRLLGTALWGSPVEIVGISAEEWQAVYEMACKQTVQGIVFDAVRSLPSSAGVPRELAVKWLLAAEAIERNNAALRAVVERQREVWQRNGVDALLLKGLTVADMYPVPEHRMTGDIDWLFRTDRDWNAALDIARRNGMEIHRDSDGDISYVLGGIVVEHHRGDLPTAGVPGILTMLNEHILHHAMTTGVGLRHICDMAVAYKSYSGRYMAEEYGEVLKTNGLMRWTALLHRVLQMVVGIPEEYLPELGVSTAAIPDRDVKWFVDTMLTEGNFGFSKRRRFSGLPGKLLFYVRYAPTAFLVRWTRLVRGRMRRTVTSDNV